MPGETKEVSDKHQTFLDNNKSVREADDEKDPVVEFRKTEFEHTAYLAITTLAKAYANLLKGGGNDFFARDQLPMHLTKDQLQTVTLFQNKTDNYLGLVFIMLCDQNKPPMNDDGFDTIGTLKEMSPLLAEWVDVNYSGKNKNNVGQEDVTYAFQVATTLREIDGPVPFRKVRLSFFLSLSIDRDPGHEEC